VAFKNAHHIRGPIARILGLIQLIRMDANSQESYINYILEEAQSADLIVNKLNDEIQEYISDESDY
jgi:signal transduction histidine kinase